MENNEIMERLLQDDKASGNTVKDELTKQKSNGEVSISRVRIVTAKYKVYIVLLIIFICAFFISWIPNINKKLDNSRSTYNQLTTRLSSLKNDIRIAEDDMKYLCDEENGIVANDTNLKNCLNRKDNCRDLPETWMTWSWEDVSYDLSVPLSYLQLNSLYNKKMHVDEKTVIKNLNEYLIKHNISGWDKNKVWDILRINIWEPSSVSNWNNKFFQVPVDVEIEFKTVWDLTWFLYNVEKKMVEDKNNRILYKIQSVSYDIVSKDEPQVTNISMIAYYYYDEKFDGMQECENLNDLINSENIQDEEIENWKESESFFKDIFKNIKK